MGATTEIAWTHATFNHVIGCTKVAPGCTHCYAEAYANRYGKAKWGPSGTRVMTSQSYWRQPLKWNREAEKAGERRRVFCASLADVFEDWDGPITAAGKQPVFLSSDGRASNGSNRMTMDDVRRALFFLIDATPHLDWLILTKRPENVRRFWKPVVDADGYVVDREEIGYRENVWLLTSVSEQASAEENIEKLSSCRDLAPVLGISAEPLLGPIELRQFLPSLDWIICGGESGGQRRQCEVEWLTDIVRDCREAGVPCFVKQDSALHAGQQGRIPDDIWSVKQFPAPGAAR